MGKENGGNFRRQGAVAELVEEQLPFLAGEGDEPEDQALAVCDPVPIPVGPDRNTRPVDLEQIIRKRGIDVIAAGEARGRCSEVCLGIG